MDFSEVIPGRVYQGPVPIEGSEWAAILSRGVNAIVDLQMEWENGPGIAVPPNAGSGLILLWAPIPDADAPSLQWMQLVGDLVYDLYKAGRVLYIHCQAGVSRASLVDTILHMLIYRIGWEEAYSRVKAARPVANPNPHFRAALAEFEAYLEGKGHDNSAT